MSHIPDLVFSSITVLSLVLSLLASTRIASSFLISVIRWSLWPLTLVRVVFGRRSIVMLPLLNFCSFCFLPLIFSGKIFMEEDL
jgi:hypothetical protein